MKILIVHLGVPTPIPSAGPLRYDATRRLVPAGNVREVSVTPEGVRYTAMTGATFLVPLTNVACIEYREDPCPPAPVVEPRVDEPTKPSRARARRARAKG